MTDRLTSMEAFVLAAESGSFVAAASLMGISAQMVAKHVQALEGRLGVRLLHRTTRRQHLTEFGAVYLERCKSILAEADAADALAHSTQIEPRGTLRVTAPYNFGSHSLVAVLTSYLAKYPKTLIELTLTDRFVNLIEEGFEIAFRIGNTRLESSNTLVCRRLKPYSFIACASPDYLKGRTALTHPDDLSQHECLGYVFWDRLTDTEWTFARDGKSYSTKINSRLKINDTKAQVRAALDGFGIIISAEDMVGDHIREGRLVRVLPDYNAPSRALSLIYPVDRTQTAKLKTFVSHAMDALG
ncbi:LysR family transcriptional regulator [Paraburkholderia strydomiana]|uniref:LysR family transcriptional regulator n=1 Tax=Paraburkholderia strydomiana TaxID=1245417 RepID=UPI0038B7D4EB